MVEGMSNFSLYLDLCENRVYGKQNRVIFPFGAKRVNKIIRACAQCCVWTCVGYITGKVYVLCFIHRLLLKEYMDIFLEE